MLEQVRKLASRQCGAVKITLRLIATHVSDEIELLLSLRALLDGGQIKGAGHVDHGQPQLAADGILRHLRRDYNASGPAPGLAGRAGS